MSKNDLEIIQNELKWVHIPQSEEQTFLEKLMSKGISGFLVPSGCLITAGILTSGLYYMFKKNKRKQQMMMRYRVAAQGITVLIAMFGILGMPFTKPKAK